MAAECPRCGARRSWLLRDGRRRCARCRLDWRPGRLPLRLSRAEWRVLISWFVRGAPSAEISRETGLERKRVLRALGLLREGMLRAKPGSRQSDPTEFDAPSGEGAARPKRLAVVGIYDVQGQVGADLLTSEDVEAIRRMLGGGGGDLTLPANRADHVAVVIRRRLHRLPRAGAARAPFGQIEAFWAYLQRHLRTKGGIRPARLGLYLAEYSWRYNRRRQSSSEKISELMKLIRSTTRWPEWDYRPRSADDEGGLYSAAHTFKH